MGERAEVPDDVVARLDAVLSAFPRCRREAAWTGERWRVGGATVAHVFGGEDGLVRVVFHVSGEDLLALEHLGPPYFRTEWGADIAGLVVDGTTDWDELTELLTDSYCLQAPRTLAAQVERPDAP